MNFETFDKLFDETHCFFFLQRDCKAYLLHFKCSIIFIHSNVAVASQKTKYNAYKLDVSLKIRRVTATNFTTMKYIKTTGKENKRMKRI